MDLGSIFESFSLFSTANGLGDHLAGYGINCDYTGADIYRTITYFTVGINLFIVLNYYYGLFNLVKLSKLWVWLVNLIGSALITGFIAYGYAAQALPDGEHCKNLNFSAADCTGFGLTTASLSSIVFIILSIILKWGSSHQSKVPF